MSPLVLSLLIGVPPAAAAAVGAMCGAYATATKAFWRGYHDHRRGTFTRYEDLPRRGLLLGVIAGGCVGVVLSGMIVVLWAASAPAAASATADGLVCESVCEAAP